MFPDLNSKIGNLEKKIATTSYQDIPSIYRTWLSTLSILHHWSRHSAGRSPSAPEMGPPQKNGRGYLHPRSQQRTPVVMHLMVNTLAMIGFFSSNEKYSFHFVSGNKKSQWETTCKKKCLTHLRKIAAGTSEDLLRNVRLCLKNPFGGVDRDPVISPPRFLHDLVGGDSYNPSYNPSIAPLLWEGGQPKLYYTILKIISLIKVSQSQVPGIVMDTVYSFNVATTPIYAGFGWINCV